MSKQCSSCGGFCGKYCQRENIKQEQGEPVAYGFPNSAITGNQKWMSLREQIPENDEYKGALWIPLYDKPQIKEWVWLTDENIFGIFGIYRGHPDYNHDQLLRDARRIESKIKGLNT